MKSVQQRIAAFPAAIGVDLRGLQCRSNFGVVKPGEPGYEPVFGDIASLDRLDAVVCAEHQTRAPTEAEREAALAGSMFGWHVQAADPQEYEDA